MVWAKKKKRLSSKWIDKSEWDRQTENWGVRKGNIPSLTECKPNQTKRIETAKQKKRAPTVLTMCACVPVSMCLMCVVCAKSVYESRATCSYIFLSTVSAYSTFSSSSFFVPFASTTIKSSMCSPFQPIQTAYPSWVLTSVIVIVFCILFPGCYKPSSFNLNKQTQKVYEFFIHTKRKKKWIVFSLFILWLQYSFSDYQFYFV